MHVLHNTETPAELPFETRIDLSEDARRHLTALLNQTLADTADLYSQTKQAHWNAKGPAFYPLHLLYDDLAAKLVEPADLVAERIVLLGGYAFGTVRMAAANSRIAPFPGPSADDAGFVSAMADRWAQYAALVRASEAAAAEIGEPATVDLYAQIAHVADRGLWFIEGHLQRYRGGLPHGGGDPE